MKSRLVIIGLSILLTALVSMAQTANDFRQKYKTLSTTEIYEVRPNITATVKYGLKGKPEEMRIEVSPTISNCPETTVSTAISNEIIDEIVPQSMRGDKSLSFQGATSSNNIYNLDIYTKLSIFKRLDFCDRNFLTYRSVVITFSPPIIKTRAK